MRLRRCAVTFTWIDWHVHLSVLYGGQRFSRAGQRGGEGKGQGVWNRDRPYPPHTEKSLLWSLEHHKALLPCTFGPGHRIIPIMQHVWLLESPTAILIQLWEERARDVIQYTPNPWHTRYFYALFVCCFGALISVSMSADQPKTTSTGTSVPSAVSITLRRGGGGRRFQGTRARHQGNDVARQMKQIRQSSHRHQSPQRRSINNRTRNPTASPPSFPLRSHISPKAALMREIWEFTDRSKAITS